MTGPLADVVAVGVGAVVLVRVPVGVGGRGAVGVRGRVRVGVGPLAVGVARVGVRVLVGVAPVGVRVRVAVGPVAVRVGVRLTVGVCAPTVLVELGNGAGVRVMVRVREAVRVGLAVALGEAVSVSVGVAVGGRGVKVGGRGPLATCNTMWRSGPIRLLRSRTCTLRCVSPSGKAMSALTGRQNCARVVVVTKPGNPSEFWVQAALPVVATSKRQAKSLSVSEIDCVSAKSAGWMDGMPNSSQIVRLPSPRS